MIERIILGKEERLVSFVLVFDFQVFLNFWRRACFEFDSRACVKRGRKEDWFREFSYVELSWFSKMTASACSQLKLLDRRISFALGFV